MEFKLPELVIPLSRENGDVAAAELAAELGAEIAREALDAFEKRAKKRLYGK